MINAKVAERFTCQHAETIRCKKVKANHQAEYRHQCATCGMQVGNAIAYNEISRGERESLPKWNDHLGPQFEAAKSAYWKELADKEDQRMYQDWIGQYRVYLKTAEWKHLRERVIGRAGAVCEGCGHCPPTRSTTLLTYMPARNSCLNWPHSVRNAMIGFTRRATSLLRMHLRLRGACKVLSICLKKVGSAACYPEPNPSQFLPKLLKPAPNVLQVMHERIDWRIQPGISKNLRPLRCCQFWYFVFHLLCYLMGVMKTKLISPLARLHRMRRMFEKKGGILVEDYDHFTRQGVSIPLNKAPRKSGKSH